MRFGLYANFCVCWFLAALLWVGVYGSWSGSLFSAVMPILTGYGATLRGDVDFAVACWVAVLLPVTCVTRALRRPGRPATLLAHGSLLLYWFWSVALIGMAV